jgi:membrane protease YdiL (CAAX protease family)
VNSCLHFLQEIRSNPIAVEHALILLLAVVGPIIDWLTMPRIKRSCNSATRRRYYLAVILSEWATAGIAVWCIGETTIWSGGKAVVAGTTTLGRPLLIVPILMLGLTFLTLACTNFLRSIRNPSIRDSYARAVAKSSFRFLFPTTSGEIRWFVVLSLTAGICEEIVYRSFLINYFFAGPLHFALPLAFVFSTLLFGIAHVYQGWVGIIQTAITGIILGLLFLATGSLLLVIVVHALVDLQVVLMLRPGWESKVEQASPKIQLAAATD